MHVYAYCTQHRKEKECSWIKQLRTVYPYRLIVK